MQSRIAVSGASATVITLLMGGGLFPVFAQSQAGQLSGIVYDQAGARLDQAAITVKNAATGAETATHPSDKGEYRFGNLPVGKYSIRVSATNLSSVQINDILIQANRTATINVTLPTPQSTPISVVEVSEAPQPVDAPPSAPPAPSVLANPAPPPTPEAADDPKAILREIAAVKDRLALSADQQTKIRGIFQDRQTQIAAIRADASLLMPARREKIKSVRAEAEAKFRAALNENQLDEYEEILRERRDRALQKQQATLASH
jgi:hypothetical protein